MGTSGVLEHKSDNISETRKDRGKVTMEAAEGIQELTNALSNGTILDPLRPPFPQDLGFATPQTPIAIISETDEAIGTSNLAGSLTGSFRTKAH